MSGMPKEIWVYDRNGKLEARDVSIVVGDVKYILYSEHQAALDALRVARESLLQCIDNLGGDDCVYDLDEYKASVKQIDAVLGENKNV